MNIQEIKRLRINELNGELRSSNFFVNAGLRANPELLNYLYTIDAFICHLTTAQDKQASREILNMLSEGQSPFFYFVKGEDGTFEDPYIFNFALGKGLVGFIIKADSLFGCDDEDLDEKYREQCDKLKQGNCFENCFDMAKFLYNMPTCHYCHIISGIISNEKATDGKNCLHSVIKVCKKVGDMGYANLIIDFNHNLCMTEEAYMTIFDFEPLNVVNAEKIFVEEDSIGKFERQGKFDKFYFNFATEDYIDYLNNPARQRDENIYEGLEGEFNYFLKYLQGKAEETKKRNNSDSEWQ